MLFAHLKRISSRLDRLRLRGPLPAPTTSSLLAATAQNLRKLAKLIPAPGQARTRLSRQDRAAPEIQSASEQLTKLAKRRVFQRNPLLGHCPNAAKRISPRSAMSPKAAVAAEEPEERSSNDAPSVAASLTNHL